MVQWWHPMVKDKLKNPREGNASKIALITLRTRRGEEKTPPTTGCQKGHQSKGEREKTKLMGHTIGSKQGKKGMSKKVVDASSRTPPRNLLDEALGPLHSRRHQ